MHRIRVSVAGLLGVMIFCGLVFAALRSGSNDWFKLTYGLTFMTLLYGAIAARYRGPFWYGFAVAGWAYFLIGFGPWIGPAPGTINRNLGTSVIAEMVSGTLATNDPAFPLNPELTKMMRELRWTNRQGICHSILTIVCGFIGGLIACALAPRSREKAVVPASSPRAAL